MKSDLSIINENRAELKSLQEQLEKEFALMGYSVSINNSDSLQAVIQKLSDFLKSISSRTQLWSIVYRIDISEKEIQKSLQMPGYTEFEERMAWLIAERCYQKIITRRFFSNDKKQLEE